jgi:hypothetical protein
MADKKYKIFQILPEMYPRIVQTIKGIYYDGNGDILNIGNGIIGAQGPQGPISGGGTGSGTQGPTGPQGPIGLIGLTGPQGPIGLIGLTGPQGPAGSGIYYVQGQPPAPTGSNSGDRWYDLTTGYEYVWINDGDSSQWVTPVSSGLINNDRSSLSYNTILGISVSIDNLSAKLDNDGYLYLTPISGTFTWYGPTVYTINGQSISQFSQTGQTIISGTWYAVPSGYTLSSAGDTVVSNIALNTGNAYRVTAMKTSVTPAQAGITIERLY